MSIRKTLTCASLFMLLVFTASKSFAANEQTTVKSKKLDLELENKAAFTTNNTTIYFVKDNKITALNRSTWKTKWVFQSTEKWIPKLEKDGNQIYALTWKGNITALNLQTGKKVWSKKAFKKVFPGVQHSENYFMSTFISFFLFKDKVMISQLGSYVLMSKSGKFISLKKIGIYAIAVKGIEHPDYYVINVFEVEDRSRYVLPNRSSLFRTSFTFMNNNKLSPQTPASSTENSPDMHSSFTTYKFEDQFLSASGMANIYPGDTTTELTWYRFDLYKLNYSQETNKFSRQNLGFFSMTSDYINREEFGKTLPGASRITLGWCDYTEIPYDHYLLGILDNRFYFMTNMPEKRFAYVEMSYLAQTVNVPNPPVDNPNAWASNIQYTNKRPKSLLSNLGFNNVPSEMNETDVYATKFGNRYVLISNNNKLRVFDGSKVMQITVKSHVYDFIAARDVILGMKDVIVFDVDRVQIFQEDKK